MLMVAAAEEVGDGDEDDGAEGGGGEGVQKATAENSQFDENPAAKVGTDQSQDNICYAAESASASNLPGEPARDEAKEKPGDKAVRFEPDSNSPLRSHLGGKHEAS